MVLHGRAGRAQKPAISAPLAELRAGELVGEIGFLRKCPAHRRCDCDPRHQRSGADAHGLPGPGGGSPGDRRGGARGAGAAVRQGDRRRLTPVSRIAEGTNRGA